MNKEELKIAIEEEKKIAEAIISDLEKIEAWNVTEAVSATRTETYEECSEEDKVKFTEIITSWERKVSKMLADFFPDSYIFGEALIRVSDFSGLREFKFSALQLCAFVEDEMKDGWQTELKEKIVASRRELALANIK